MIDEVVIVPYVDEAIAPKGAVVSTPKATAPPLAVAYEEVTLLLLVDITLQ